MIDQSNRRNRALLFLIEMLNEGNWSIISNSGWFVKYTGKNSAESAVALWQALHSCELSVPSALYAAEVCTHEYRDHLLEQGIDTITEQIVTHRNLYVFTPGDKDFLLGAFHTLNDLDLDCPYSQIHRKIYEAYMVDYARLGMSKYRLLMSAVLLLVSDPADPHTLFAGFTRLRGHIWLPTEDSVPRVDIKRLLEMPLTDPAPV